MVQPGHVVLLVDAVLIETFVETAPPRPRDAARLLDEMSGSTRGPREPGGAVEGVAGRRRGENRESPRAKAATPLRPDRLPMRCVQALAVSSGTLAQR